MPSISVEAASGFGNDTALRFADAGVFACDNDVDLGPGAGIAKPLSCSWKHRDISTAYEIFREWIASILCQEEIHNHGFTTVSVHHQSHSSGECIVDTFFRQSSSKSSHGLMHRTFAHEEFVHAPEKSIYRCPIDCHIRII
jgi:hypothetical protein